MEFRKLDVFLCVCLAIFSVVRTTTTNPSTIPPPATPRPAATTTTPRPAATTPRPAAITQRPAAATQRPAASQPGPGSGGAGGVALSNCGMGCKNRLDPQSVNVFGANFKGMGSGSASVTSLGIWRVVTAVFIVTILLLH